MKKLLAFGLFGIFFAATAMPVFSQGVTYQYTDVGASDGTYAEGNKSASATVTLKFKLKDKVAIAIADASGNFTTNALFQGYVAPASVFSAEALKSDPLDPEFLINGAVYTNANQNQLKIDYDSITMTHLSGIDFGQITVGLSSTEIPTTADHKLIKTLNRGDLNGAGGIPKGVYPFAVKAKIVPASLEVTDRAGDYEGSLTITMAVL